MSKVKIAKLISIIFHPFIWILFGFFIIAIKELFLKINVLFIILPILVLPFAILWVFIKKGFASNVYLTDKRERVRFIALISIILLPLFIVCLLFFNLPKAIILIIILLLINIFAYLFLSRFIKISAHIGVINSIVLTLSLLYGANFILLILLEIPIAWARYTLKHHSVIEMFLAFIMTSIIALLAFIAL